MWTRQSTTGFPHAGQLQRRAGPFTKKYPFPAIWVLCFPAHSTISVDPVLLQIHFPLLSGLPVEVTTQFNPGFLSNPSSGERGFTEPYNASVLFQSSLHLSAVFFGLCAVAALSILVFSLVLDT